MQNWIGQYALHVTAFRPRQRVHVHDCSSSSLLLASSRHVPVASPPRESWRSPIDPIPIVSTSSLEPPSAPLQNIPIISIPNRSIEQPIRRKVVCIDILLVKQELVEEGKQAVFERGREETVGVVADFDEAVVIGDAHRCVDGVGLDGWGC